jgi:hypothetical protein
MCIEELNKKRKRGELSDFTKTEQLTLYWTILLHDIAKYNTLSIDDNGEAHYFNHENIGSEIFDKDLSLRLLFSNNQKKEISWIIKNHLKLFLIPDMRILKSRKLMMNKYFSKLLVI